MYSPYTPREGGSRAIRCITQTYTLYIPIIALQAVKRAEEHLLLVTQERSVYRQELDESRRQTQAHFLLEGKFVPPPPNVMIAPASNNITAHYSFDFAQQVHYPSNPLQPGPIYFLTPRKAAIFGVCCEAIPRQVNFVIDEASDTGKGANTVVSLLDFIFSHYGLGEATASLHADNCCGQNKNNTMVQYLMWRVLTGLHQTISLHFMISGHTKFSPDACFGLIKRKFSWTDVSSLDDLARVVEESAACNICQLVGAQDGSTIVPSRDWARFLSSLPPPGWYKAVPSLSLRAGLSRGSLPQEDCHGGGGTAGFAAWGVVTISGGQTSLCHSCQPVS